MLRANSFLLSVCSPVLHRMLCGCFAESKAKKLELKDVHSTVFGKALGIFCGREHIKELDLGDVKELASVADRFQMTEVVAVLDMTISKYLTLSVCGEVLSWSGELGLRKSEVTAQNLATDQFEDLAKTEGFMQMDEQALGRLLDDDNLVASSEEAVWEAVVEWRRVQAEGQARGLGLVGKIRFPLMEEGYLRSRVVGMAPAEEAEWMEGVVAEALRAKAARGDCAGLDLELLGPKALDGRVGLGVRWEEYTDGDERRLKGHAENVWALAEVGGRVCSGSQDGSIRVWSMVGEATEPERMLVSGKTHCSVHSMSAWEGRLISGHNDGMLRVWDVVTGACDQVLEGHTQAVDALAVIGSVLASGSADRSITLWAMRSAGLWTCESTLLGHTCGVVSLAGWQGKVLSGSRDSTIRVWDEGTGAHDATLVGHGSMVLGLAVHGDRLFSSSHDGTIRVWAMGTWSALQTVKACAAREGRQCPCCLAVSGSQLVSGSIGHGSQREVRVWGLATESLDLQHTLLQPAGADVMALLAVEGAVWAGVGRDVVVWGRRA